MVLALLVTFCGVCFVASVCITVVGLVRSSFPCPPRQWLLVIRVPLHVDVVLLCVVFGTSAVLAFKCMSELAPAYLSDKLITRSIVSNRETRNSQMLNIPLFRSATGQKIFHYRTVNIWNNLNNNVKLCIDVKSFRNKLRGALLDKFKREE